MRFQQLRGKLRLAVCLGAGVLPCLYAADVQFSGPTLGLIPDSSQRRLLWIEGVPGGAWVGREVALRQTPAAIFADSAAAVAVVRYSDGWQYVDARNGVAEELALESATAEWTSVAWSRDGSAWLACASDSGSCEFWRFRDGVASRVAAASGLSAPRALAVANNADYALASDESSAWLLSRNNEVSSAGQLILAAAAGQNFAALSAGGTLSLLHPDTGAADEIASGLNGDGIATDASGRTALIASSSAQTIAMVDLASGSQTVIECDCQPDGIWPLANHAAFRLGESVKTAIAVLQVADGEPRLTLIPASQKESR